MKSSGFVPSGDSKRYLSDKLHNQKTELEIKLKAANETEKAGIKQQIHEVNIKIKEAEEYKDSWWRRFIPLLKH